MGIEIKVLFTCDVVNCEKQKELEGKANTYFENFIPNGWTRLTRLSGLHSTGGFCQGEKLFCDECSKNITDVEDIVMEPLERDI